MNNTPEKVEARGYAGTPFLDRATGLLINKKSLNSGRKKRPSTLLVSKEALVTQIECRMTSAHFAVLKLWDRRADRLAWCSGDLLGSGDRTGLVNLKLRLGPGEYQWHLNGIEGGGDVVFSLQWLYSGGIVT